MMAEVKPGATKTRAPRTAKPKSFGKILGDTIDLVEGLHPDQREKLLGALHAQYPGRKSGPNDAGM
jgi:hypothetical protein